MKLIFQSTLLALVPTLALAETDTVVVTANRTESELRHTANAISVIDQKTIELVAGTHVNEPLTRVPGIWISRGNGQEHLTAIRSPVFTGSGSCGEFLMLEDGIPIRAAGFCNANQLFELNTEQAQRIEVLRGPGSALYGSNAVHGVINVIAAPADAAAKDRIGVDAGRDDYARSKLSLNGGDAENAFNLSANASHDGGFADDSGYDQQKLTLRQRLQHNSVSVTNGLSATNLNQETASYIEGHDAYEERHKLDDNSRPEAFRDASALRLYSRWEGGNDEQAWSVTPYARHTDMRFLQHFLPNTPLEENDQQSGGIQLQSTLNQGAFALIAGADGEWTRGSVKQTQAAPFSATLPQGTHYDFSVDAQQLAPYLQASYALTPATTAILGGRLELTRYDYNNHASDGSACAPAVLKCRYTRPADADDSYRDFSPKFSVLHDFGAQQLYINLSRGMRAPQVNELYRLQSGQQRADIDSERSDSAELGWRLQQQHFSADIALYDMRKRNFIFQDSSNYTVDDGASTHRGIEYQLDWQLAEAWRASINGSFARHRYEDTRTMSATDVDGHDMDTAPRHQASAQLSWTPTAQAEFELEWVQMGPYYQDPESDYRYNGHQLLNLRGRLALDETWTTSARITNLTDTRYAERADVNLNKATGMSTERYFVGEPRALWLGIEASF